MTDNAKIRNFAIVAHIDHGKSTLADRLLEITNTIDPRKMQEQVLDSNPIERERGITIKLAPVRMKYVFEGQEYILNLIDTPGHVDFSYEVSRSLTACEGIILVVDATQGIQAQTVAHMNLIKKHELKVIPVINKIDLPTAHTIDVKKQLFETFKFRSEDILEISAKQGINIKLVLEAIIRKIPPPRSFSPKFKALIFSSVYDTHQGVINYIRVLDGSISKEDIIKENRTLKFYASNVMFKPLDLGFFMPQMASSDQLSSGEVGFISTGLKDLQLARVGDTVSFADEKIEPFPGFRKPKPMVFLSLFPIDNEDYILLRTSLEKLQLSDSSFTFHNFSSPALGKGFLCGFLGLLHGEIVKERLFKEFNLNIITTAPSVEYKIILKNKKEISIFTPEEYPDPSTIEKIKEPVMMTTIYTPQEAIGKIMQLCQEIRGEYLELYYLGNQAQLIYLLPLSEMIVNFFDNLKSLSQGYASFDYEFFDYRSVKAVKLDILLNKKISPAFSRIIVEKEAQKIGNRLVEKLKKLIPRHQFQIPIQAAIGSNIIARADIPSFRKDVTAKLYGGDRTRKDKLLEAQKKGKKKMKMMGNVEIPQEVFLKIYQ